MIGDRRARRPARCTAETRRMKINAGRKNTDDIDVSFTLALPCNQSPPPSLQCAFSRRVFGCSSNCSGGGVAVSFAVAAYRSCAAVLIHNSPVAAACRYSVSFLPGPARCARRRYTRRSALTSSRRPEKSLVGAAAAVAVAAARAFWDCERRGRRLVALRCGLADADAARQPSHCGVHRNRWELRRL